MKNLDFLRLWFDADDAPEDGADKGAQEKGEDKGTEGADDRSTPKYSDDDLDKILSKRFARWQKEQKKATDEAARLATMTAQERAEHERDALQAELDDLKHRAAIAEMEKTAREILQKDGVNVPDTVISSLVSEDADETNKTVKAFAKAFKDAVLKEVKSQLAHKAPLQGKTGTLTKSDIMKVADPDKRQKLIRENLSLFQ